MNESFYVRHSWKIIIGLALLYPVIAYGALQAVRSNTNDVKQWLPAGFQETQEYQWFRGHFEAEEFVLVSWDGCTLHDERLERFAKQLDPPPEGAAQETEPLFSNVVTGPRVLELLTTPPTNLEHEQAVTRLEGSLVGHDRRQTCAVLTLSEAAKRDLHRTLDHVYSTAEACGVPRDTVRMGGPPVDNVAIDNAGQQSLFRLAAFSGLIGLVISWRCLRSWWLVAMVFGAGLYSAAASLAAVYYTGVQMNAILLTMPPLVYVAATSGAIHLANYYREVVQHCSPWEAPAKALRHALLPLSLATGTTAVGLMSLCISDLVPIQLFGLYSAIGVCISMLLLVFFVPSALQVWPQPALAVAAAPQLHTSRGSPGSRRWALAGHKIIRHNGWVALGCLAVMGFCGYGLTKVQTSVQLMRLFDSQARILKDYGWLEEHVGELVPMEVVLHVDQRTAKLSFLEQMELVQTVQKKVEAIDVVGSSLSAVTFAPAIPDSKGGGWSVERSVRNKRLLRHRDEFLAGDYLRESEGKQLWRITARVGALKDVDYGQFVTDIREVVEPLLTERGGRQAGVHATYTGLVPLVYKAQRSLLDGLIFGFFSDLVLITIVMMLAVRDWSAGLLLIAASAFPAVVIFGLMGWLGIVVDVGTVMAPAVALGVTVDDVVHFMLSFRQGLAEGQSRRRAILGAYRTCGKAMYQSWGVIGLGLAVFALSPFRPTQCFGYLMATLLTAALAGNLLLLPSLLASPLGRFFKVRQTSRRSESDTTETCPAEAGLLPALSHTAA